MKLKLVIACSYTLILLFGCATNKVVTMPLDKNLLIEEDYSTIGGTRRANKQVTVYDPTTSVTAGAIQVLSLVAPDTGNELSDSVVSATAYLASGAVSDDLQSHDLAGVAPGVYIGLSLQKSIGEKYNLEVLPVRNFDRNDNASVADLSEEHNKLDPVRGDKFRNLGLSRDQVIVAVASDPNAGLLLDIDVYQWETTSGGSIFSSGPLELGVLMTLFDNKKIKIIARDTCEYSTQEQEGASEFPSSDEYLANDMSLVREITTRAAEYCIEKFKKSLQINS